MMICPCCGKILREHIRYNAGMPFVWRDCVCGYTTDSDTGYSDKTSGDFHSHHYRNDVKTDTGLKRNGREKKVEGKI